MTQKMLTNKTIALNKKAHHDYFIEDRFEAGIMLEGWEVKSLRDGRAQLRDSYVLLKNGEAWLLGSHIAPLSTAAAYLNTDPIRTRKLLLKQSQIDKLSGKVVQKGYTVIPLSLYWKKNKVKCEIGLAKGKKLHDKRSAEKTRDWNREKERWITN
jgi:SsrA-binding protein